MTRKQFETLTREIQRQEFKIEFHCDAFSYATQRAEFNKQRLLKLISEARKVRGSKTVARKVARWERQLGRVEKLPQRIAELKSQAIPS